MLAYDDFTPSNISKKPSPYWRRNGAEAADLLTAAAHDYERCSSAAPFDRAVYGDLRKAGGEKYAQICALAYRQCLAANKLVADANGSRFCSK